MDIAVLDACPGFKEHVLHAAQDRDESVEVVQGVDQQRNPVGDDRCGLHQAAAALAPGRGQEDPVLYKHGDQLDVDHRQLLLRGRTGRSVAKPVVRLPEFEHKFDLPPRIGASTTTASHRQQFRLAIGHDNGPVLPIRDLPRRHAAMLLGLTWAFCRLRSATSWAPRRAINRGGRRWLTPGGTDTSIGPDPVCRRYCNRNKRLALGVEDRRAMLQPRDAKKHGPREVLEPIQTRMNPGRTATAIPAGATSWAIGLVASLARPGVIRSWRIEPVRKSHSRWIFIAASPGARCRHSRGTGRPVGRAVRWYCCRRCERS